MPKQIPLPHLLQQQHPDVQLFQQSGCRILRHQHCHLNASRQVFKAEFWYKNNAVTGSAAGRGTTLFVRHDEQHMILRQYLRGGLPGKLLSNQFVFNGYQKTRAWREFFLLLEMHKLGLPVPEPVMAGIDRSGLIYRNYILIKRIPDAVDLHQKLTQQALSDELWVHLGGLISSFHEQQIYHHDLNIRNIMLDKQNQGWLIDFDKCARLTGDNWKAKNLQRLHRSLEKEQAQNERFFWNEKDWDCFIQGYEAKSR